MKHVARAEGRPSSRDLSAAGERLVVAPVSNSKSSLRAVDFDSNTRVVGGVNSAIEGFEAQGYLCAALLRRRRAFRMPQKFFAGIIEGPYPAREPSLTQHAPVLEFLVDDAKLQFADEDASFTSQR